jgi:hypothetical protein
LEESQVTPSSTWVYQGYEQVERDGQLSAPVRTVGRIDAEQYEAAMYDWMEAALDRGIPVERRDFWVKTEAGEGELIIGPGQRKYILLPSDGFICAEPYLGSAE